MTFIDVTLEQVKLSPKARKLKGKWRVEPEHFMVHVNGLTDPYTIEVINLRTGKTRPFKRGLLGAR